jgi:two-component system nitrate/nitrite response regulator NarL
MQMSADLRILIVARNPLARIGLGALLARHPGFDVVGEVSGDVMLTSDVESYHPDVLVWDLDWESVAEPFATLGTVTDPPPILALLPDAGYAAQAWGAGASGLLLRDADAESLAAAVNAVSQGLAALDRALAMSLFPPPAPAPAEELTAREREVLQLLAEGLPNKAIAARLTISEHTVKFHVNAILTKLGVQSRTEAVVRAVRLGLIML